MTGSPNRPDLENPPGSATAGDGPKSLGLPPETVLRMMLETGRMAPWRTLPTGEVVSNPALNRLLGFEADARPTLAQIEARMPGQLQRLANAAFAALELGGALFEAEICCRRAPADERWFLVRGELLSGADGAPGGAMGVLVDITDRKRAEDSLKLLAREADHRAANLLTVLQGIVALAGETEVEALKAAITGRLMALAKAHKLLTAGRWSGADLHRLLEEETSAYTHGQPDKITMSGPERALTPAEAQGMAMAFHELATNAAKYGALSRPEGRVEVTWAAGEDGALLVRWCERGGPEVKPPARKGFGALMITRALSESLGAEAEIDWRPEGLVCTIRAPGR